MSADTEVLQILEQVTKGKPEFYFFTIDNPPFWLRMLLAGGILASFLQKPYMVAYAKGTFHFVPTSIWTPTSLRPGEAWSLAKADITEVKFRKFGPAHYFTLTLKSGKKLRLVSNTLYKKLEKHVEGMMKFKEVLGA